MIKLRYLWRFIPVMVLGIVLLILYKSLTLQKSAVAQEKPFPTFSLADLRMPEKIVTLPDLKKGPCIVHVWATWCGICVKEHNEWLKIKKKWSYDLVGVVYRDEVNQVKRLLQAKGDPYQYLLHDASGTLGLNLGLIGTPETFVIDKKGIIRYHQYGPVSLSKFEKDLVPLLEKISRENG
ncbi:MAG: redoxin family protein [Proteobacteria bacterium]|nr:redoxin family protein [Pseudomonadota bacterium]